MTGLALPALLGLSFSAGAATFFAPCAFPLLPGYLSYFLSDTVSTAESDTAVSTEDSRTVVARLRRPLTRAIVLSTLAGAGMTVVYVGLAGTTAYLGAQALADIAVLELIVGSVFVIAGALMMTGWKLSSRSTVQLPKRQRSLSGFFIFGALYAGAAAGCTAPLFIAIVLQGVSAGPILGVGIALTYALGMSTVLAAFTCVTALGGSSITAVLRSHTQTIYRIAGALLVFSGAAEIYYYFFGFPEVLTQ
ncbi:cytochrome c biogenesis CcdA family protein [Halobellus marinus]|uniref:cytochrome c biogenesis CcdA family protein n=1 Tax=Halobellus TaxID=1073986 RepID=UPI0028AE0C93|nr:cytochrome c biogenesis protein CcdA [Halobellus sp. DFY28]